MTLSNCSRPASPSEARWASVQPSAAGNHRQGAELPPSVHLLLPVDRLQDAFERLDAGSARASGACTSPRLEPPAQVARQPFAALAEALEAALDAARANLREAAAAYGDAIKSSAEQMAPSVSAQQLAADLRAVRTIELEGHTQLTEVQVAAIEQSLGLLRAERDMLQHTQRREQETLTSLMSEHLTQAEDLHALQLQSQVEEVTKLSQINEDLLGRLRQLTVEVQSLKLAQIDREAQQAREIVELRAEVAALRALQGQRATSMLGAAAGIVHHRFGGCGPGAQRLVAIQAPPPQLRSINGRNLL